jgi:hypothetical protein
MLPDFGYRFAEREEVFLLIRYEYAYGILARHSADLNYFRTEADGHIRSQSLYERNSRSVFWDESIEGHNWTLYDRR